MLRVLKTYPHTDTHERVSHIQLCNLSPKKTHPNSRRLLNMPTILDTYFIVQLLNGKIRWLINFTTVSIARICDTIRPLRMSIFAIANANTSNWIKIILYIATMQLFFAFANKIYIYLIIEMKLNIEIVYYTSKYVYMYIKMRCI